MLRRSHDWDGGAEDISRVTNRSPLTDFESAPGGCAGDREPNDLLEWCSIIKDIECMFRPARLLSDQELAAFALGICLIVCALAMHLCSVKYFLPCFLMVI